MPFLAHRLVCITAFSLLACTLFGCRKPKPPVEVSDAVCTARVAQADAAQAEGATLDPALWTSILVANYDRVKHSTRGPGKDCMGKPIAMPTWQSERECPPATHVFPDAAPPAQQAIAIEAPLAQGAFLVWTPIMQDQRGDGLGPVGLGQWTANGVDILAVGTVAAHLNRAALRLESTDNATLLAIESDRCDEQGSTCAREIAIFVQDGTRIVTPPLVEDNGTCVGKPVFVAHRKQVIKLDNGIERTFELQASLQNPPTGLAIQEQVVINDRDPATPDAPPRPFRQASLSRLLRVSAEQVTIQPGLWEAMLREHGSVRPDALGAEPVKP